MNRCQARFPSKFRRNRLPRNRFASKVFKNRCPGKVPRIVNRILQSLNSSRNGTGEIEEVVLVKENDAVPHIMDKITWPERKQEGGNKKIHPRNPTWNCMLFRRSANMNLWHGLKWILFPGKSCN